MLWPVSLKDAAGTDRMQGHAVPEKRALHDFREIFRKDACGIAECSPEAMSCQGKGETGFMEIRWQTPEPCPDSSAGDFPALLRGGCGNGSESRGAGHVRLLNEKGEGRSLPFTKASATIRRCGSCPQRSSGADARTSGRRSHLHRWGWRWSWWSSLHRRRRERRGAGRS